MQNEQKYEIGTQYLPMAKHPKLSTVTDFLTVTNSAGEIVKTYYESQHEFMGQMITNHEVCAATIARGIFRMDEKHVIETEKYIYN